MDAGHNHISQAARNLLRGLTGRREKQRASGIGAIFRMQRLIDGPPRPWDPGVELSLSTKALEAILDRVRDDGYEVVSLDEAHWRLVEGDFERPFVSFTFDGGYRDVIDHGLGIFRARNLPFAVAVCTDFADGAGDLWWRALEHIIREVDEISLRFDGEYRRYRCSAPAARQTAFDEIHSWLRSLPETEARRFVRDLSRSLGLDFREICVQAAMGWDDLRRLANQDNVTIVAHGMRYLAFGPLSSGETRLEVAGALERIELELGRRPRHVARAYGATADLLDAQLLKELGVRTGLTGQKGLLEPVHSSQLSALPRMPLGKGLGDARRVSLALKGVPVMFGGW